MSVHQHSVSEWRCHTFPLTCLSITATHTACEAAHKALLAGLYDCLGAAQIAGCLQALAKHPNDASPDHKKHAPRSLGLGPRAACVVARAARLVIQGLHEKVASGQQPRVLEAGGAAPFLRNHTPFLHTRQREH